MNLIEALRTGRIVVHDQLIGGYVLYEGSIYHRDDILDFNDMQWIKDNVLPSYNIMSHMPLDVFLSNDWKVL
jgi:hypothetical protein